MKTLILLLAIVLFSTSSLAEQIAAEKVCVGIDMCVGGHWSMSRVERAYGVAGKSTEREEGVKQLCLQRGSIYIRLQYDLRSKVGLKGPAALDVASDGPPDKCEAIKVKGPALHLRPIALGESEANVKNAMGSPDEIWTADTSDHGILPGETGLVYGGGENNFVLIVLRAGVVVRVAGSVLP